LPLLPWPCPVPPVLCSSAVTYVACLPSLPFHVEQMRNETRQLKITSQKIWHKDSKCDRSRTPGPDLTHTIMTSPKEDANPTFPSAEKGREDDCESFVVLDTPDEEAIADMNQMVERAEERAEKDSSNISDREVAVIKLVELRAKFEEWAHTRENTICKLREIADYVDSVCR